VVVALECAFGLVVGITPDSSPPRNTVHVLAYENLTSLRSPSLGTFMSGWKDAGAKDEVEPSRGHDRA